MLRHSLGSFKRLLLRRRWLLIYSLGLLLVFRLFFLSVRDQRRTQLGPVNTVPSEPPDTFEINPFVTFIIPSSGQRSTLKKTLTSLKSQILSTAWEAKVGLDGFWAAWLWFPLYFKLFYLPLDLWNDPRLTFHKWSFKVGGGANHSGRLRNALIKLTRTPWFAFVDDDDSLAPDYVSFLHKELQKHPSADCIIFRMKYPPVSEHSSSKQYPQILPPQNLKKPLPTLVGISFAVRREFWTEKQLAFDNNEFEDYNVVKKIYDIGGELIFSKAIVYNVKS